MQQKIKKKKKIELPPHAALYDELTDRASWHVFVYHMRILRIYDLIGPLHYHRLKGKNC